MNPEYSPDFNKISLARKEANKIAVYCDGFEGVYDGLTGWGGSLGRIVLDGEEQKRYHPITSVPFFSPDGERLLYIANRGTVVVDGEEVGRYDLALPMTQVPFSPDGRHF